MTGNIQWRLPLALQVVCPLVLLLGIYTIPESRSPIHRSLRGQILSTRLYRHRRVDAGVWRRPTSGQSKHRHVPGLTHDHRVWRRAHRWCYAAVPERGVAAAFARLARRPAWRAVGVRLLLGRMGRVRVLHVAGEHSVAAAAGAAVRTSWVVAHGDLQFARVP